MKQILRCSHRISVAAIVFCLILLVSASLPQAQAETVTQTRYMDSDYADASNFYFRTWQIGTAYRISETLKNTNYRAMQIGIKVYINVFNSTITELTSGTPMAVAEIPYTTTTNMTASYNATWTPPLTNLTRQDTLQIAVWRRLKTLTFWGSWAMWTNLTDWSGLSSFFLSEALGMDKLLNSTWTAHYWIRSCKTATPTYYWAFLFGDTSYNSRIENITYNNGIIDPTESNNQYFVVGGTLGGTVIGIIIMGFYMANRKRKNQYVTEPSFSDT